MASRSARYFKKRAIQDKKYMRYTNKWGKLSKRFQQRSPKTAFITYIDRDDILRAEGFLVWERFWLAQHDINTPGMQDMRAGRKSDFAAAHVKFDTWNDYRKSISDMYRNKGYTFRDGRLNPFKLLDATKKQGKLDDTPQPKRRKADKHPSKAQKEASRRTAEDIGQYKVIQDAREYQKEHRLR